MERNEDMLKLVGYDQLGHDGNDGIRYAWQHASSAYYVESAAFSQRSKAVSDDVCGYTTSVSAGCKLKSLNCACHFCRTGMLLPFDGLLTAEDIVAQNVFMVLSDMHCADHKRLKTNSREFAYMGQGEPGYSYLQIKEAIILTDIIMEKLNQNVFRHIIASSGIPQMIREYKNDLANKTFSSQTTFHFSLHGAENRNRIMPIDIIFPYQNVLEELCELYSLSGQKPCVGILLLKNFVAPKEGQVYSTDVENILDVLDPAKFRLSFCDFNDSPDLGSCDIFSEEECRYILDMAKKRGFEAKLFSSFGKEETTACGMLGGKEPLHTPSHKWRELEGEVLSLVNFAKYKLQEEINNV
ncbi:hypothetical protein FACS18949_15090 [Clostridia bacterium]|nr:hypothetical protein FACS18949_15090 [Clostridia bacterium]